MTAQPIRPIHTDQSQAAPQPEGGFTIQRRATPPVVAPPAISEGKPVEIRKKWGIFENQDDKRRDEARRQIVHRNECVVLAVGNAAVAEAFAVKVAGALAAYVEDYSTSREEGSLADQVSQRMAKRAVERQVTRTDLYSQVLDAGNMNDIAR